jgi:fused signal recognition particle receptor
LTGGIAAIFKSRKLDAAALEELEDLLITADLGVATAALLTANLARDKFDKDVGDDEVRTALAANIAELLSPVARPLVIDRGHQPHVVMFVGVNGSGKTTTIGKMAQHYRAQGLTVMLAAADTFRAAAIEQLQIWGQRVGVPVVARAHGADSAAVAYEALARAQAENIDLLLIDTAGRLQNKTELMDELAKVVRVLGKQNPEAPHDRILVLDGTVGQNAHSQVQAFSELTDITGLVVTKLDGSARGGVVVSLTERFGLPIHAIGVGEAVADLDAFAADDFARNLMGLD